MTRSPAIATLAVAGIALAAAAAGYAAATHRAPPTERVVADERILSRLDAIERRLALLAMPVAPGSPGRSAGGGSTDPRPPASRELSALSGEDLRAARNAHRDDLERAFLGERIDAAWALPAEASLDEAVASDELLDIGDAPETFEAACRTDTCRIVARFGAGADADTWRDRYLLGAASTLGSAQSMVTMLPDGGFEVVIYGRR